MKNSTQRTSCVHNSKKSGSLSGIMQLSMAILFAFSITTQAEAMNIRLQKYRLQSTSKVKSRLQVQLLIRQEFLLSVLT